MDTHKIDIVVARVTIAVRRNRKVSNLIFDKVITKGNDFETMKRFIRMKRVYKEFKPGVDHVSKIEVIKKVGETAVIDN